MIVFHELVYVGPLVSGSGVPIVYSHLQYHELLGQADSLHVSGYASQVTGSGPNLSLSLSHSYDGSSWYDDGNFVVRSLAVAPSETLFQALLAQDKYSPMPALTRVGMCANGATLVGHLSVWITGRDTSSRARGLVASVS